MASACLVLLKKAYYDIGHENYKYIIILYLISCHGQKTAKRPFTILTSSQAATHLPYMWWMLHASVSFNFLANWQVLKFS